MVSGNIQLPGFPHLHPDNHAITSRRTPNYNCIAWAANDTKNWWWPEPPGSPVFWPPGVCREETLHAFMEAFATLGYEECENCELEAGYEKVALYAGPDHAPTHAARQLDDGAWTSKLGPKEDIEHRSVNDVSGPNYGAPVRFIRRRKSDR